MQAVLILGAGPLALAALPGLCAPRAVCGVKHHAAPFRCPRPCGWVGAQTLRLDIARRQRLCGRGQTSAAVHCVKATFMRHCKKSCPTYAIAQAALRAGKPLVMGDNLYMYGRQRPLDRRLAQRCAHTQGPVCALPPAAQLLAMAARACEVAWCAAATLAQAPPVPGRARLCLL